MSKKAILLTFISAISVVVLAGALSYVVWVSQPSADVSPPIPPDPNGAPTEKPPVPPVPRLRGDILDDGIVSALDINSIVVRWKQIAVDYNLVDGSGEPRGIISGLDLAQTIKYWKCVEQKGETACPYLTSTTVDGPPIPTVSSPIPTATTTSTITGPPVPQAPTNQ